MQTQPASTLPFVVDRQDMVGITSMEVEGEVRNLGIVKNFRDNAILSSSMPTDLSISWAHLDPDETLQSHRHPVASLIVAMEGNGQSVGDSTVSFSAGDALLIPPWNEHGFRGGHPDGLWALSIQFTDIAIFESAADPLTQFTDDDRPLPPLLERQIRRIERQQLVSPRTFRGHTQLKDVLPNGVDFSWQQVDGVRALSAPAPLSRRLLIACDFGQLTSGMVVAPLRPGVAFWQRDDVGLTSEESEVLWLLMIEVGR